MLGLRLRYQISGFLFFLFTTVILIIGYFNMSILNDLLNRFALYQSKTTAGQVANFFEGTLPEDTTSLRSYVRNNNKFNEFKKYSNSIESIYNFKIYGKNKELIYSFRHNEDIKADYKYYLAEVSQTKIPMAIIWAYDKKNDKAIVIENYGFYDNRIKYYDYYYPIIQKGRFIGLLRVSLRLKVMSKLMKFFFIGNTSLAFIFILTAFIAIYLWSENAINRPIRNLLEAHNQLKKGNFSAKVILDVPSNNELGIIANSFNAMACELKKYQEELKEQKERLEEVNAQYLKLNENLESEVKEKTMELREFFSLITHDLKIPLSAIKGYTALLKKEKTGILNPKQSRFINCIENADIYLLDMVKNMLDSVKYEDGRVMYFMEDFDLLGVVLEVESHIHPIIGEKNIKFIIEIPENCRIVYGDRGKIGQVIINIVSNAINYSPQGGTINIKALEFKDTVEVQIADNGIGIPPEQLPIIFEKFQRIPNKESPSTSIGLGLYIVSKILEGHGMKPRVESKEGEGSTFYFSLQKGKKV